MAEETTDNNFESDVLKSETPVLVDFFADWCGPCKQLAPILDEVSEEMSGKIKVLKVNIDKNPDTPTSYGVRGIPTMIMFKGGEAISTKVGSLPKSGVVDWVEESLSA